MKKHFAYNKFTDLMIEYYRDENNQYHHPEQPAILEYYLHTGVVIYEAYYFNGVLHRNEKPAVIKNFSNGNVFVEEYYTNGKLSNYFGYAYIEYNKHYEVVEKLFYIDGHDVSELVLVFGYNPPFSRNEIMHLRMCI